MTADMVSRPKKAWHFLYFLVLIIAITASFLAILKDSGAAPAWPMDQAFIETVDLRIYKEGGYWNFHYPKLQHSGGVSSSVLVGLYKLIIPTRPENLNWHIRTLAMLGYLLSTDILLRTFVRPPALRIGGLLLVASSGFAFIQPSSEILAGSLFTLFVVAATRRWPVLLSSLLLVAFALCKVEFLLAAPFLGLLWWWREQGTREVAWRIPVLVGLWIALFLLPGFAVHRWGVIGGGRSFQAFAVHYATLFVPHQYQSYPFNPWLTSPSIMKQVFPGAESVRDVIAAHPRAYIDFLALSAIESIRNIALALKLMLLPAGFTLLRFRYLGALRFPVLILATALVCTLVPGWLFAFVHIRYLAKFYPAIIGLSLAGVAVLQSEQRPVVRYAMAGAVITTLVLQAVNLPTMWQLSHQL